MRSFLLSAALLLFSFCGFAQGKKQIPEDEIRTGADRTEAYLPLLKGKKVALVVNQTSEINGVLLPDTLLKLGVDIVKIFSPEHGFRGHADAGAKVKSGVDGQTGLPVVSLYGNNKKPAAEQLKGVDIVVYDLQDVGVRFYTYISTLQYLMEACAENNKPILLLDRPNPLGFIVDGPLMTAANMSFVGMQPIPVVYGMTAAEYAKMLMGEKWLKATDPELTIVECRNYTHASRYNLPVPPSPNLKTMAAIYLYPSLCLFEGTVVSVGRGTDLPFQQFGHPALSKYSYTFTPTARSGATDPPLKNKRCYGLLVASDAEEALKLTDHKLQLKWLLDAYRNYPEQPKFFNAYFKKLAGTDLLQQQIAQGATEEQIRASWKADLDHFRSIRKKYLLYAE